MNILITGFDPFGGEKLNPAFEAVRLLPGRIGSARLFPLEVPTVFGEASRMVTAEMDRLRPDAVLCVGQAGGRDAVTPEKIAINCMNAVIADNAGHRPCDERIMPDGPAALFSTLPLTQICERIREKGIPARISYHAGTFVCNELMYSVLLHAARADHPVKAGFIHVPYIPQQLTGKKEGTPALPLPQIAAALEATVEAIIRCGE